VGVLQAATTPWSYSGATGPDHWGDLNADWAIAKTGRRQSPVNIVTTDLVADDPSLVECRFVPTRFSIVDTGQTIQLVPQRPGNRVSIGDRGGELLQAHFHAPGEHLLDGRRFPLELHLVFGDADVQTPLAAVAPEPAMKAKRDHASDLLSASVAAVADVHAVLGVFIVAGRTNEWLREVLAGVPADVTAAPRLTAPIDLGGLVSRPSPVFSYAGSLTTPPCTQGVTWLLLASPVEFSAEQIGAFTRLYDQTARPVQPLNGRKIRLHTSLT